MERGSIEPKQIRLIYAISRKMNFNRKQLHDRLRYCFNKNHIRELSKSEAYQFANYIINSKHISLSQMNKILSLHKEISSIKNYKLNELCKKITKEENLENLSREQASKLIQKTLIQLHGRKLKSLGCGFVIDSRTYETVSHLNNLNKITKC